MPRDTAAGTIRAALTVAGFFLVLSISSPVLQAQESPTPASKAPREEAEAEHRNEAALIVAGTKEIDGDSFFTLGAEYERRLRPRLGVVAEIEYLFPDRWIMAVPIVFHANHGVKIFGGPGFERAEVEEPEEAEDVEPDIEEHSETQSFDFVREEHEWEHAVVFGISIGVAF